MKKVIRIKESELKSLIEKVILEASDDKFIQKAEKEINFK